MFFRWHVVAVALVWWPCAVLADSDRLALVGHVSYPSVPLQDLFLVPTFHGRPLMSLRHGQIEEDPWAIGLVLASDDIAAQFTVRIRGKDFFPDGTSLHAVKPNKLFLLPAFTLGPNPQNTDIETLQQIHLRIAILRRNIGYSVDLLENGDNIATSPSSIIRQNKAFVTVMRTIECQEGNVLADIQFHVPMPRDLHGRHVDAVTSGETHYILLEWINSNGTPYWTFVPHARLLMLPDLAEYQGSRVWTHSPEQDTFLQESQSDQCRGDPLTFHSEYPSEMARHVETMAAVVPTGTTTEILMEETPTPVVYRPSALRRFMSTLPRHRRGLEEDHDGGEIVPSERPSPRRLTASNPLTISIGQSPPVVLAGQPDPITAADPATLSLHGFPEDRALTNSPTVDEVSTPASNHPLSGQHFLRRIREAHDAYRYQLDRFQHPQSSVVDSPSPPPPPAQTENEMGFMNSAVHTLGYAARIFRHAAGGQWIGELAWDSGSSTSRANNEPEEFPTRRYSGDVDVNQPDPNRRFPRAVDLGSSGSGAAVAASGAAVRPTTEMSGRQFQQRPSRLSRMTRDEEADITPPMVTSSRAVEETATAQTPGRRGVPVVFESYRSTAGEDCPICMQAMEPGHEVGVIQCNGRHTFCVTCMQLCMSRDPRCPLCRATVDYRHG